MTFPLKKMGVDLYDGDFALEKSRFNKLVGLAYAGKRQGHDDANLKLFRRSHCHRKLP